MFKSFGEGEVHRARTESAPGPAVVRDREEVVRRRTGGMRDADLVDLLGFGRPNPDSDS